MALCQINFVDEFAKRVAVYIIGTGRNLPALTNSK
jgi:hypothetical protein